jgi:dolichol-phosphate mannosyltransferase
VTTFVSSSSRKNRFHKREVHLRIIAVIPTYNEAENLPQLVSALFALPLDLHALVVDDDSPDGTGSIADDLARQENRLHVIHRKGIRGLRSAYLDGFRRALEEGGNAILQMDADFSHDPQKIPDMVQSLESFDVVLGSRYVSGGSVDNNWPPWRKNLSAFANFYARTILGLPQHDVTTGFRLWRRETLLGLPFERIQSNGYIFLVEMVYLAFCLEYKIGEVPIYFLDRRWGRSKMSLKIQAEAALRVWSVWWNFRDLHRAGRNARESQ